tara:strand:- start:163 stop:411 length:249 start_codon:yes stop_codon:yes gene_type:complete
MNGLVIILLLALIWVIRKFTWNIEEGTTEQRERNPELNTKNFDLHEIRLKKFSKSKYKNRMFYIGTDGSCYYYSATGRKVFC